MMVSKLEGAKLDYWVAVAEGLLGQDSKFNGYILLPDNDWDTYYSPSSDWSQGGPIIEREGIKLREGIFEKWHANLKSPYYKFGMSGPTALIAAMRALVASRFGPEVDDR